MSENLGHGHTSDTRVRSSLVPILKFSNEKTFLKTHFSRTEWDIYNEWTDYVFENSPELKLDGIIYLRAEPTVCADRMRKRGRLDESGVTLEYLKGTGFCISEVCSTAPPFGKPGQRNS